jgi:hypothetical protein
LAFYYTNQKPPKLYKIYTQSLVAREVGLKTDKTDIQTPKRIKLIFGFNKTIPKYLKFTHYTPKTWQMDELASEFLNLFGHIIKEKSLNF